MSVAREGDERTFVYVGTDVSGVESASTDGSDAGIFVYELDQSSGDLTLLQQVAADAPSYLVLSPSRNVLYAGCRGWQFEQDGEGAVLSYSIDPETGLLTLVDEVRVPPHPAYMSLDRTESFALMVFALAGSVAVVPLGDGATLRPPSCVVAHDDGPSIMSQGITGPTLGKKRWSSDSVMPHSVIADRANRFVLVCDVGLNRIAVYRFDAETGTLTPNSPPWVEGPPIAPDLPTRNTAFWESPRGAGPRHMCFNAAGDRLYVTNESSSTISVYAYDGAKGVLERIQDMSTLPAGWATINSSADIQLHPSGTHLYMTNRGHDSVAVFAIARHDGTLELIGHTGVGGKRPRSLAFSPDGEWLLLANIASDSVRVAKVDTSTGLLELCDGAASVPSPACVKTLSLSAGGV